MYKDKQTEREQRGKVLNGLSDSQLEWTKIELQGLLKRNDLEIFHEQFQWELNKIINIQIIRKDDNMNNLQEQFYTLLEEKEEMTRELDKLASEYDEILYTEPWEKVEQNMIWTQNKSNELLKKQMEIRAFKMKHNVSRETLMKWKYERI